MFPLDINILIADDMPTIRDLVKTQLRQMGYKSIIEAQDGQEALNKLLANEAANIPIHLIISDWNMPKLSGLDFLKEVRSRPQMKNLPFVLLTSETERDQVTEAIMAGVSQYIVKPFTQKTFDEKLRSAWTKHSKPA